MREIKFRAWDEEENEMIEWEPTFFYDTSKVTGYGGSFDDINIPLMQFTGLKDVKGNEIYEGDITKAFGKVYFKDGSFGCDTARDGFTPLGELMFTKGDGSPEYDITIIGNIYENKELLTK